MVNFVQFEILLKLFRWLYVYFDFDVLSSTLISQDKIIRIIKVGEKNDEIFVVWNLTYMFTAQYWYFRFVTCYHLLTGRKSWWDIILGQTINYSSSFDWPKTMSFVFCKSKGHCLPRWTATWYSRSICAECNSDLWKLIPSNFSFI